jgi:lipopolysaccharide/colanic/teichoic acid biosynthesis glycosyltransferase
VYKQLKRLLDVLAGGGLLLLSLPLLLVIVILMKLENPNGPILYRQERVGHGGKLFTIYKFRTMIPEAEKLTGAVLAAEDDPRVTKVGSFLRKRRLDELPQIFNVLRGEMSLVGPRPERPEFVQKFSSAMPDYLRRLEVKPGLTGWWQVSCPYHSPLEERVKYDTFYVENLSFPFDLKILLQTPSVMLRGRGEK